MLCSFGLQGAPATFQQLMDKVIHGFLSAYMDIFNESWEEHIAGIRKVLARRLHDAELTAKPSKCVFGANKCKYIHVVGNGVVEPHPSKVQAVLDFPAPTTKTQVRAFLGLTEYYC